MTGLLAGVQAKLGQRESALAWLKESRSRQEIYILYLDEESFDNLRDDPRFAAFIRELKLPEDFYLRVPDQAPAQTTSP